MRKNSKQVFYDDKGIVKPQAGIKKYSHKIGKYKLEKKGNSKMGAIACWSTLMGDFVYKNLKGVLHDITGTCHNCEACKTSCYVRHSYNVHPAAIVNHAKNTWGMRNDRSKVAADIAKQLSRGNISIVRINASGEIENEDQFALWCTLAYSFKDVKFYIYTKNYPVAEHFLLNGLVPKNFVVVYSVWGKYGVAEYERVKHLPNVKAFVFDDGNMYLNTKVHCPAYVEKFKTSDKYKRTDIHCIDCKLCFNSKVKVIACHDH